MKFICTIFIFVLIACYQTPIMQLLKLPVLIEHFNKHKQLDQVTMMEFLKDHYAGGDSDDDQSEDNKLPFKSGVLQDIGNAVVNNFAGIEFSFSYNISLKNYLRNLNIPQNYLFSIFHPPRV